MTNTLGPGGSEIPLSKNLLYPRAVNGLAVLQARTAEAIGQAIEPRFREGFLQDSQPFLNRMTPVFTDKRIECDLGDAEQISFRMMMKHDESFMRIDCNLFAGSSPKVFDEDIDHQSEASDTDYTILTTPEFPPFLVLTHEFDDMQTDEGVIHGDASAYLEFLRTQGRAARFLSADEQNSVMDALDQADLDPAGCRSSCYGDVMQLRDYL